MKCHTDTYESSFTKLMHVNRFKMTIVMQDAKNYFTLTVFLMSCDSQSAVALPHGAVDWSAE